MCGVKTLRQTVRVYQTQPKNCENVRLKMPSALLELWPTRGKKIATGANIIIVAAA